MFENMEPQEIEQMKDLLRKSASMDEAVRTVAQKAVAVALTTPLRKGIVPGDTIAGIFARESFDPAAPVQYPIDFYRPDNASEFVAYTMPNQGKVPQRQIEGDYVQVPTYRVANAIDWLLDYAKYARWDIMSRVMEVYEAGFVKKRNDDGFHVLLAGGFDRNIVVSDANAAAGQFTKRLVSLMKLVMRRNGGGNSNSLNRYRMTNLFVSPEAIEDIRNWGIDQADEITRREIFLADDEGGTNIFNVKIAALDELGENQEYQNYYEDVIALGAANSGMASGDLELVIGLDLSKNNSFVNPVKEEMQVFDDPTLHRESRAGIYGWSNEGFAVLDNRSILLGSM